MKLELSRATFHDRSNTCWEVRLRLQHRDQCKAVPSLLADSHERCGVNTLILLKDVEEFTDTIDVVTALSGVGDGTVAHNVVNDLWIVTSEMLHIIALPSNNSRCNHPCG